MKKFLSASLLIVIGILGMSNKVPERYFDDINLKASRDLRKRFTNLKDEKWYRHKNWYTAWFTMDGINFRVEYDRNGNWSGTERDYTAEKLDPEMSELIRHRYTGYTISWIREITLSDVFDSPLYIVHGTTYIIHIENEHMGKTVSVNGDMIRVMEEYPKS